MTNLNIEQRAKDLVTNNDFSTAVGSQDFHTLERLVKEFLKTNHDEWVDSVLRGMKEKLLV